MPLNTGVNDTILMEATLIGWAFASMIGQPPYPPQPPAPCSGFRGSVDIRTELAFAMAFGALSVLLLSLVNSLFFAA